MFQAAWGYAGIWPLGGGLLGALADAIKQILNFVLDPPRGVNKQKNICERGSNSIFLLREPHTGNTLFE